MTTSLRPSCSIGVSESAGRAASRSASMCVPVMEFFGVGFIKKVVQRLIEFVGTASATKAKRQQKIFEEGLMAGDEGRDELIFNFDFVSPAGQNFVANEVRAGSSEIDGPGAAARASYKKGEFGVDNRTGERSLGSDEIVKIFDKQVREIGMSDRFCRAGGHDAGGKAFGGGADVVGAGNAKRFRGGRFVTCAAVPNIGSGHVKRFRGKVCGVQLVNGHERVNKDSEFFGVEPKQLGIENSARAGRGDSEARLC